MLERSRQQRQLHAECRALLGRTRVALAEVAAEKLALAKAQAEAEAAARRGEAAAADASPNHYHDFMTWESGSADEVSDLVARAAAGMQLDASPTPSSAASTLMGDAMEEEEEVRTESDSSSAKGEAFANSMLVSPLPPAAVAMAPQQPAAAPQQQVVIDLLMLDDDEPMQQEFEVIDVDALFASPAAGAGRTLSNGTTLARCGTS